MKYVISRQRNPRATWLRTHAMYEESLTLRLTEIFSAQGTQIADPIRDGAPALFVLESFSVEQEAERMFNGISSQLLRAMLTGAASMRENVAASKQFDDVDLDEFSLEVPPEVVRAIRLHLRELGQMQYWKDIQATTKKNLGQLVLDGISQGLSNPEIAKQIRLAMGSTATKARAISIARSEATGALNSGHYESLLDLGQHDPGATKVWSAIVDESTRDSHEQINGQTVPVDAEFTNGGRYPGDPMLPAAERINCRCTVLADVTLD